MKHTKNSANKNIVTCMENDMVSPDEPSESEDFQELLGQEIRHATHRPLDRAIGGDDLDDNPFAYWHGQGVRI